MEKKSLSSYFPILIDLKEFKSLVIGGGNIATRKVFNLLEFNTFVTVISPIISDELHELVINNKIKWIERVYNAGDISDFDLIFCATGDTKVDELVFQACKVQNVLLNVADVPSLCNFIMPSTLKRGDLTISVASQGKAPFFVRETGKKLRELYPEITSEVVELAALLREKMIEYNIYNSDNREKAINDFFKINWEYYISEKGIYEARANILRIINKYI